jgi:hypothetical protein
MWRVLSLSVSILRLSVCQKSPPYRKLGCRRRANYIASSMNTTIKYFKSQRKSRVIGTILSTIAAAVLASGVRPATALSVPAACYTDDGILVTPTSNTGHLIEWTLTVNFNHKLSKSSTPGCIALRDIRAGTMTYTVIKCPLLNNRGGALVGNGRADFDGALSIGCDLSSVPASAYDAFSVRGRITLPGAYSTATLATLRDMRFSANLDEGAQLGLESVYGGNPFSDRVPGVNYAGQRVDVTSMLGAARSGIALHQVDGRDLDMHGAQNFGFGNGETLLIGAAGEKWTAEEIIIDPGTLCCRPK